MLKSVQLSELGFKLILKLGPKITNLVNSVVQNWTIVGKTSAKVNINNITKTKLHSPDKTSRLF